MLSGEGAHFLPRLPERSSGRAEGAHEHLVRGGVDDCSGVGDLNGGGDLGEVMDVEGGGRGAAEAVRRVLSVAPLARAVRARMCKKEARPSAMAPDVSVMARVTGCCLESASV